MAGRDLAARRSADLGDHRVTTETAPNLRDGACVLKKEVPRRPEEMEPSHVLLENQSNNRSIAASNPTLQRHGPFGRLTDATPEQINSEAAPTEL